jgi:3alpha(or 20beta)-hydroxysteroid dehydrogenase
MENDVGRLAGKVALVTGGARGMGAAHVRRFVAEGAKVVFGDILEGDAADLASQLGESARFVHLDVCVAADWARAVEAAEAAFGPVSILVNNAGIVLRGTIETFSESDYRKVIDVNQLSVFLGMKSVFPSMRRAGSGSIINISSIAGLVGRPATVAYTASKFAIRGMTKVAAAEFGDFNIRVNSVHPGAVLTPMFSGMDEAVKRSLTVELALKRLGDPDEVSSLVLFLASDESSYCTASEFVIDGGLTGR